MPSGFLRAGAVFGCAGLVLLAPRVASADRPHVFELSGGPGVDVPLGALAVRFHANPGFRVEWGISAGGFLADGTDPGIVDAVSKLELAFSFCSSVLSPRLPIANASAPNLVAFQMSARYRIPIGERFAVVPAVMIAQAGLTGGEDYGARTMLRTGFAFAFGFELRVARGETSSSTWMFDIRQELIYRWLNLGIAGFEGDVIGATLALVVRWT